LCTTGFQIILKFQNLQNLQEAIRLDDSLGTVIYFTGLNSNHTLPDCFCVLPIAVKKWDDGAEEKRKGEYEYG
jgi:hypothetical protein